MCDNFFLTSKQLFFVLCSYLSSVCSRIGCFWTSFHKFSRSSRRSWALQSWIRCVEMSGHQIRESFICMKQKHVGKEQMSIRGGCRLQFQQKVCLKLKTMLSLCLLLPEGGAKPPIRSPNLLKQFFTVQQRLSTPAFFLARQRKLERAWGLCLTKVHFALCSHSRPKTVPKENKGNIKIKGAFPKLFVVWAMKIQFRKLSTE